MLNDGRLTQPVSMKLLPGLIDAHTHFLLRRSSVFKSTTTQVRPQPRRTSVAWVGLDAREVHSVRKANQRAAFSRICSTGFSL